MFATPSGRRIASYACAGGKYVVSVYRPLPPSTPPCRECKNCRVNSFMFKWHQAMEECREALQSQGIDADFVIVCPECRFKWNEDTDKQVVLGDERALAVKRVLKRGRQTEDDIEAAGVLPASSLAPIDPAIHKGKRPATEAAVMAMGAVPGVPIVVSKKASKLVKLIVADEMERARHERRITESLLGFNSGKAKIALSETKSNELVVKVRGAETLKLQLTPLRQLADVCGDLYEYHGDREYFDQQTVLAEHSLAHFWSVYYHCVHGVVDFNPRTINFAAACSKVSNQSLHQ